MKKLVKKYGNSAVIVFSSEDQKIYDFKIGDVVDIELVVIKEEKKNG